KDIEVFKYLGSMRDCGYQSVVGLQTSDDFRFVRLRWEVSVEREPRWNALAKGGSYSPYFSDIHLVINWHKDGREIKEFVHSYVRNEDYYFRPGLTWPHRTTSEMSVRILPSGCIFSHKGPTTFVPQDKASELLALLAVMNS